MKNNFKGKNGLFQPLLLSICVFVGVGFITGGEIWQFFAKFGCSSIFGLVIFALLTYFLVLKALTAGERIKIKNRRFNLFVEFFSETMIASAMISGLNNLSKLILNNNFLIVTIVSIFVMFLMLYFGLKSFLFYNYFVFIFVCYVFVYLLCFNNISIFNISFTISIKNALFSIIFALIYIFMNIAELNPVLNNYQNILNLKQKKRFSFIFSILLSLMILCLVLVLQNNTNLAKYSMPFLVLFYNKNSFNFIIFSIGLFLCLVSTCESCLFGIKNKLNFFANDNLFSSLFSVLLACIFGQIPFSFFVSVVYPVIGCLNLIKFVKNF